MKPRTESRNSSWSSSNSVRSMAATVTRWLRGDRRPARLAGVDVTIEPFAWASDLAPADLAAVNRIYNDAGRSGCRASGRVSDGGLRRHGPLQRPPGADGASGWRATTTEPSSATATRSGGRSRAGARCACSSTRRHRRQGVGRALGRDARRGGAGRWSHRRHASRWRRAAPRRPSPRRAGFQPGPGHRAEPHRSARRSPTRSSSGGGRRARRPTGYSLVAYDVPCPSDDLARDFIHARHVMNDAPRYEGEAEAHLHASRSCARSRRPASPPTRMVERRRAARRHRRAGRASASCTCRPSGRGSSSRATPACAPTTAATASARG